MYEVFERFLVGLVFLQMLYDSLISLMATA